MRASFEGIGQLHELSQFGAGVPHGGLTQREESDNQIGRDELSDSEAMVTFAARQEEELSWQVAIPVATNPFFLYDLTKGIAIAAPGFYLLVAVMCAFSGDMEPAAVLAKPMAMVAGGLWVFIWLVGAVFYGSGYPMEFKVGRRGVSWGGERRDRGEIRWKQVKRVHYHRQRGVICLLNGWRVMVRLYCAEGEYERVAGLVAAHYERAGDRERTRA